MHTARSITPILIVGLLSISPVFSADAPDIDRMFPPGMQQGTTVSVKLEGKPGDGKLKAWTNHGQLAFEFVENNQSVSINASKEAQPGIHWIRFYNEHGATDLLPFIVGTIPEIAEVEPNNDAASAQQIDTVSATVNGVLAKADDVDTYAVSLKAGKTFVASMQANRDLGSPMDAVLQLLSSDGAVMAHNDDDHGFDPQIAFEVPVDGRYFVRTFAFPATPNSTIRLAGSANYVYRLTLTTAAFVDHTLPAVVTCGQTSSVLLRGWNLPNAKTVSAVPPFDGELSAVQGSFANTPIVNAISWPSLIEAEDRPQILDIPCAVTGCISEIDQTDSYTFDGKKGQKFTIEVASRSLYSLLDPVLKIVEPNGKELKVVDDRSRDDLDAEASVTLKTDGKHTIRITDRYNHGGTRFFYVLKCSTTKPEFSTLLQSHTFAFENGKPLEVPVEITRANGMAEIIVVAAEGLPDGVTSEPAESTKQGDTAKKVSLKLLRSEAAPAYVGSFRIVATAKDCGIQHVTKATINATTTKTEHLWLTVPGPSKQSEKKKDSAAKPE